MCLDAIEVTPGAVEHRPHSGPEQCKYCILAYTNFLFGLKFKVYDIATFYVFVTVITLKRLGHTLKKNITGRWDPPQYSAFCNNLSEIETFRTWPYSYKLTPENLSNAGLFFTGKYYSLKVCLSQEKLFLKALKTNVLLFSLILGKNDKTACFHCGVTLGNWKSSDSAWKEHARWSPSCIYVSHIKGSEFVLNNSGIPKGF